MLIIRQYTLQIIKRRLRVSTQPQKSIFLFTGSALMVLSSNTASRLWIKNVSFRNAMKDLEEELCAIVAFFGKITNNFVLKKIRKFNNQVSRPFRGLNIEGSAQSTLCI